MTGRRRAFIRFKAGMCAGAMGRMRNCDGKGCACCRERGGGVIDVDGLTCSGEISRFGVGRERGRHAVVEEQLECVCAAVRDEKERAGGLRSDWYLG